MSLIAASASGDGLGSGTAGGVETTSFVLLWTLWAGGSLLQQSSDTRGFWAGEELMIGVLRDREDSVSVCSKRTYFTARTRARPSVITCSRSMLTEREGGGVSGSVDQQATEGALVLFLLFLPGELQGPHGSI